MFAWLSFTKSLLPNRTAIVTYGCQNKRWRKSSNIQILSQNLLNLTTIRMTSESQSVAKRELLQKSTELKNKACYLWTQSAVVSVLQRKMAETNTTPFHSHVLFSFIKSFLCQEITTKIWWSCNPCSDSIQKPFPHYIMKMGQKKCSKESMSSACTNKHKVWQTDRLDWVAILIYQHAYTGDIKKRGSVILEATESCQAKTVLKHFTKVDTLNCLQLEWYLRCWIPL